ncbi:MAG: hypothetical protein LBB83_07025 [Treponema sp.]|jgi:hypothetical protein|nr:hypothetical protein [Treponema sp.]
MQDHSKNVVKSRPKKALFFLIFGCLFSPLFAGSGRSLQLDIFLIIDGSAALEQGRNEALDWLCNHVVDGLLQEGDRLTIWAAGEKAEELYSGSITGNETKETIKTLIRTIPAKGKSADFPGALREAAKQEKANAGKDSERLSCTLLIGGMAAGYNSLSGGEMFNLLRYSRFEDFSAWRVVTVAPGIEAGVKGAAAAFMR